MSVYRFFGSLWGVCAIVVLSMMGVLSTLAFAGFALDTVVTEVSYRNRFGLDWRAHFEDDIGRVAEQRLIGAASLVGAVAIVWILVWLYRTVRRPDAQRSPRRHRHPHRSESSLERLMRYRRKAAVGVYFGLIGIAAAVFLSLFRVGLFEDHANEMVLGIFIFVGGFCAVMAGCSAWLKAKGWNEAIAFIGAMPLGLLFVPFVRIILLASGVLPVAMVMMPIILVVVVFVLPDKSGVSMRRPGPMRLKERSTSRRDERSDSKFEY